MVHTMTQAFPFAFRLYDKTVGKSKGELAIEMLSSLDVSRPVYVLMDSWYPSKTLVGACLKKGFHVIAMLKTNRILYPKGTAQVFDDVGVGPLFLETCDEASRSYRGCDDYKGLFGNTDRSTSREFSSEPSHDTEPFFHEKPMGGRDAASQTPTVGASSCRTQLETRESTHFCFDR
ncbi:Uncharacterised protein [Streptococcus pneumoniae]|nr:Uncharacterised protein [Streptococcus pneumoniae]